jgi:hypothetical protein
VRAVALEGFSELAAELRDARTAASSADAALRAVAAVYLRFAQCPQAAFAELAAALAPVAGNRDLETLGEVAWSALHGLAALARGNRLRASHQQARLDLLVDQLAGTPVQPRPDGP